MKDFLPPQKLLFWFIGALFSVSIIPFLWLAFYNHPSADDYICTIPAMKWGPITSTIGWYYSWSSRYTAAFLLSINPLVYRWLLGYQLNTWLLLFLLGTGFFYWFKTTALLPLRNVWVVCLMALSVYVCSVPSVVEAFYYFGGAICYQPANAMLLVLISWWINKIPFARWSNLSVVSFFQVLAQGFLLFLIAGSNEMAMMFGLAITGSVWLYLLVKDRTPHFGMSLLLFASTFSTGLVLFSPATKYRMQASSSLKRTYSEVINNSFSGYLDSLVDWLSNPGFFLLLIFVWWLPVSKKVPLLERPYLIALSLISLFLSFFCFVPSFLGEGMIQGRTANALIFNFLILYMVNVAFWKQYLENQNFNPFPAFGKKLFFPLLILMATSLFFSNNFVQAFNDLKSGDAREFDLERKMRAELVENNPGDSIWVKPLEHKPKTIFFGDIGIYPQPWYDNFYAQYHGKKYIHLLPKP